MNIHSPTLRFTRGPHHYVLAGTEEGQGYIGPVTAPALLAVTIAIASPER